MFSMAAVAAASFSQETTYSGEQVYRVVPRTAEQVAALQTLHHEDHSVDWWKAHFGIDHEVSLHVPRTKFETLQPVLAAGTDLDWSVMVHDVQHLIDVQFDSNETQPYKSLTDQQFDCINRYTTWEVTDAWLDEVVRGSPIARIVTIGTDLGGRIIRGVEFDADRTVTKPHYYLDGGIHAREWISPAVVKNFILNMINGHAQNRPGALEMLRLFRWTVVPVLNIDGYRWTWSNNRLWRKTRRANPDGSFGVDPNRNSDIQWCGTGSSRTPSSDIYCGPSPFSEPCVAATRDYIQNLGNVKSYLNVHSFGQDLFIPFGYTTTPPTDNARITAGANAMAAAIRQTTGLNYRVWRGTGVLSGDLSDFIKVRVGVPYVMVPELRDTGANGFLLPESQICANSQEIWEGIVAHARYVAAN